MENNSSVANSLSTAAFFDVFIVGGGPGGVSASLYIARAGLNVAICYGDSSSLLKAESIQNYYGFGVSQGNSDFSGNALFYGGLEQAAALGVSLFKTECVGISYDFDENLFISTCEDVVIKSKSVILATGAERNKPKINNLSSFEGKGISYCAICDGFFYREKNVCVLGSGSYALEEAGVLAAYAKSVTILTNGILIDKNNSKYNQLVSKYGNKLSVNDKIISSIAGDSIVTGAIAQDGSFIKADGIFVALGVASAEGLAKKAGAITENGVVKTDQFMATSVPGLFAAGDCTGGLLQISIAVADGTIAALSAIKHCKTA